MAPILPGSWTALTLAQLGSKLRLNSKISNLLTSKIVETFWSDLRHPPTSYIPGLSPATSFVGLADARSSAQAGEINFRYRTADGSYNNVFNPRLGAAGTPYARSVPPVTPQLAALPEPELIFDVLLKRREEKKKKHPNGLSSVLFYFATIIIHDLFRSNHDDSSISDTSSYLDLSPLYGSFQNEQDTMRTFKDGKIHPDCFAEKRVHGFPPGVAVLLIMFNRYHNYVVENLAAINEDNRFAKSSETRDEDLFQTGRLIVCGLYINIILNDYIRSIVNLVRTRSSWMIDPRHEIKGGPPRGTGNQVSAEFNLIYRWHATISERDAAWIEAVYTKTFDKPPQEMSPTEMLGHLNKMVKKMPDHPTKQAVIDMAGNRLQRDPQTKCFDDEDLVKILTENIEDQANAFGARQIPECMRVIEIMGIEQGRKWQICTLNEFRKFFNLTQYKSFNEINSDKEIAEGLRRLYDTPDQVELYPGLMCEDTKAQLSPGSGLMANFSVTRAILSDAIGLVRGDRFNTTDFHPKALTSWGYHSIGSDPSVDYGHCFYKLVFTAFPQHFKRNSVYAHFPFMIPSEMKNILEGDDDNVPEKHKNYNYDRPSLLPGLTEINSYAGALHILKQPEVFNVAWRDAIVFLMGDEAKNFMLAGDGPENLNSRRIVEPALYGKTPCEHFDWKGEVKKFYLTKTRDLLKDKKYEVGNTHRVDLIRDVTNLTSVYFCAEMFLLPLKSDEHPHGLITEHDLYLVFVAVFVCVFFDVSEEKSFEIHTKARAVTKVLGEMIELNVKNIRDFNVVSSFMSFIYNRANSKESSPLRQYGMKMIQRLLNVSGMSVKELTYGHILGTAGGMVPNQGQQFAQLLDFYLFDEEGKKHWPDIVKLAREDPNGDNAQNDELMLRYVLEGSRLACASAVKRVVNVDKVEIPEEFMDDPPMKSVPAARSTWRSKKTVQQPSAKTLHKGDEIFVNLWTASRDPKAYIDPDKVYLDRDLDNDYICYGVGRHQCLGLDVVKVSLTAMLRVVAGLPQMRAVDGPQGKIKKVPAGLGKGPSVAQGYSKYMTKYFDDWWPFPASLKVQWQDDWNDQVQRPQDVGGSSHANGVTVNGHTDGASTGAHCNGLVTPNGLVSKADDTTSNKHATTNGIKTPSSSSLRHRRTASGRRTRVASR